MDGFYSKKKKLQNRNEIIFNKENDSTVFTIATLLFGLIMLRDALVLWAYSVIN